MSSQKKQKLLSKRKSRTQESLLEASYHLHYERKALQHLCDRLVHNPPDGGFEYAAIMDSFLLHARNLDHFLYGVDRAVQPVKPGKVFREDVVAEDFFSPSPPWQKSMAGQLTQQEIEHINNQLAHLSYLRTRKQRDEYPFEDIRNRLLGTLEQFVKDAPAANLCQELLDDAPIFPYLGSRHSRI